MGGWIGLGWAGLFLFLQNQKRWVGGWVGGAFTLKTPSRAGLTPLLLEPIEPREAWDLRLQAMDAELMSRMVLGVGA